MRFAEFVYYWHFVSRSTPMSGFNEETWRKLCQSYRNHTDVSEYFPDEPVSFQMVPVCQMDLGNWIDKQLMPYMTLKQPNKKHSAYELKHIAEREIGRYVCEGELQAALARRKYPVDDYYPIREAFFKIRMEAK